ncbi:MAG: hypothetical protein B6I24_06310 [Bacteroidetes bacterium 4572_128]|nr:MAG: hypothetical protein B6I24_06310 [Bacteroidetes bacterium 4572_128]
MKKYLKTKLEFSIETLERLIKIVNLDKESDKVKFETWLANEYKLLEFIDKKKTITFRYANLSDLKKVVNIKQIDNNEKFKEWFSYKYKLSDDENNFLLSLIKKHRLSIVNYNETKLVVKFIGQILNKIDFDTEYFTDWYGHKMTCKLNGYTFNGEPDFAVATGIEVPETPYFFLQEYKKSVNPSGNPEYQVLAAMLAAIEKNKTNTIKGGYIIGAYWKFMILEKLENGNYEYFVSDGFEALNFEHLKKIYIYLQAVKYLYCKY